MTRTTVGLDAPTHVAAVTCDHIIGERSSHVAGEMCGVGAGRRSLAADTDQALASGPGSGFGHLKPGPEACKAASQARPGSGFYSLAAGA